MPLDKGKGHEGDESSGQKRTSGSQTTAEQFRRQAAQEQERRRIHQQQTFAKMGEKWVQSRQERRRIHQQQTFAKMGERWDQSRRERAPEDPKKEVALRSIGTNEIDLTEHIRESQKLIANMYHAQEFGQQQRLEQYEQQLDLYVLRQLKDYEQQLDLYVRQQLKDYEQQQQNERDKHFQSLMQQHIGKYGQIPTPSLLAMDMHAFDSQHQPQYRQQLEQRQNKIERYKQKQLERYQNKLEQYKQKQLEQYQQSEQDASSSQADVSSRSKGKGKEPVPREQMEQPPRAFRTEKQLRDDIDAFVQALAADPELKPGDTLIVQEWRKPGRELTRGEVDDVKRIAVDLRESGQLDDRVTGRDSNQLCRAIKSAAMRSNAENKAMYTEHNAAWYAENQARINAYKSILRAKPGYKAKTSKYNNEYNTKQQDQSARNADEEATQYEMPHSLGPLAIGDPAENAQRVKEEVHVLSFSDPEE